MDLSYFEYQKGIGDMYIKLDIEYLFDPYNQK